MSTPIIASVKVIYQLHDNKYRIVWFATDLSVSSFNIYRSNSVEGPFTKIISVVVPDTQYFDSLPIEFDGIPFYKITAISSEGEGDISITPAFTDTDVDSYMYVPRHLNIKHYGDGNQVSWLYNIIPDGSIDATNNIFYFNRNYRKGTLEVFKNRKKLKESEFVEVTCNSFSLLATPTVGDILDCNFVTY